MNKLHIADCGCKIQRLATEPSIGKGQRKDGTQVMDVVVKKCAPCRAYELQRASCVLDAEKIANETCHKSDSVRWDLVFLEAVEDLWRDRYVKVHS